MAISWIQPSFAGGEIGPSLYGRIDMAKYQWHCASAITLSCGSMAALRIDWYAFCRCRQIPKSEMPPDPVPVLDGSDLRSGVRTPVHARYQRWCVGAEQQQCYL